MARSDPKPVKPRVKDAKSYERAVRDVYLNPFIARIQARLATVISVNSIWQILRDELAALEASPRAGVPVAMLQRELDRMNGYNRQRLIQTFRAALGVNIAPLLTELPIRVFMEAKVRENVELIKTIPRRYNEALRGSVQQTFADRPFDQQALRGVLRDEYKSSGYNLRRITRDQTNKMTGQLNQIRQGQLGIKEFIWQTVKDERVRDEHVERDGVTYSWSSPPDGEVPGEPIQCRCISQPIVTPSDRERFGATK